MRRFTNRIIRIRRGVAYVDIATDRFPHAITKIDQSDIPIMLDGRQRWFMFEREPGQCYVARSLRFRKKRRFELLHRTILGLRSRDPNVDHRSGDGTDNRRVNLRRATQQQNVRNTRGRGGSSRYKGVCWDRARQLWSVGIGLDGRRLHIGRFASERRAARAYDDAAADLYGEFARFNFPKSSARKNRSRRRTKHE